MSQILKGGMMDQKNTLPTHLAPNSTRDHPRTSPSPLECPLLGPWLIDSMREQLMITVQLAASPQLGPAGPRAPARAAG